MSPRVPEHIPVPLQNKFKELTAEVNQVVERAEKVRQTIISGSISLRYEAQIPRDVLTEHERAQSVCFVTRYESLPVLENISIGEYNGKFYVNNIDYVRHVLNDYRAIIQNKKDSVYYQKIHKFCREKLVNRDITRDLVITVHHDKDGDISKIFTKCLDEQCKAIRAILDNSNFAYIYNGILQHSDHNFTKRFLEEYSSGTINYTFIKHAQLLGYIKDRLYWHYKLLNSITFPKMGPL